MLGHIVSQDGIRIDPKRVATIDKITPPRNFKGIQSFFGKINFLIRFVTNFTKIFMPISRMLKKGEKVIWLEDPLKDFQDIKDAIKAAPILKSPYYCKPFELFTFASFHIVVGVLLQKSDEGFEQPISFFSKSLQVAELNYDTTIKQAYSLVKAINNFRTYLIGTIVVAYVPSATVNEIFTQQETIGWRCRWINRIQDFDIDIQITKLVRGQGLEKLMAKTNLEANKIKLNKKKLLPSVICKHVVGTKD